MTNGPSFNFPQNQLTTYEHNSLNQLIRTTSPEKLFTYDDAGNMTKGYTPDGYEFTATYDGENRLASIEYIDSGSTVHKAEYIYNGYGFLAQIKKYENSTPTDDISLIRSGYLTIQERDASNQVVKEYTWGKNMGGGIGGLLSLNQSGSLYTYLYDGKGNVSALLNTTQQVAASYRYDSFGNLMAKTGTLDQPFGFSTKRYDAGTGLSYYGYRFYAPTIGKWLTRDPIGEASGINLYGFVLNDPVNTVDPFGLESILPGSGFPEANPPKSPNTIQIGFGFNAGGVVGSTKSFGTVLGKNTKTGKTEIGLYFTGGAGLHGGATSSFTFDITTSDNPCIGSLRGWAGTAGSSVGKYISVGYERNTPISGALPSNTYSVGLGRGTPLEGHGYVTHTKIWKIK